MSDETNSNENKPQAGWKVALGILGFIVGLFVILWIVKSVAGL